MFFDHIVAPMLTEDLDDTYNVSVSGDLTIISCSVVAHPAAVIVWTYENRSLPLGVSSTSTMFEDHGDFVTTSFLKWTHGEAERLQAGGVYQCTAMNEVGEITSQQTTLESLCESPAHCAYFERSCIVLWLRMAGAVRTLLSCLLHVCPCWCWVFCVVLVSSYRLFKGGQIVICFDVLFLVQILISPRLLDNKLKH